MEKKYLVLIVDDRQENRILIRKILESIKWTVKEASDGKEGLEKARLHKPNLIISDVLMPEMDGFLFCKEVRSDEQLKNIPFVFYTASYTEKKDEDLAFSLGADKYIVKPIEPDDLLNQLKQLLEKSKEKVFDAPKKKIKDEMDVFKMYSERLVKKLERKMLNLDHEVAMRKQSEEKLVQRNKELELFNEITVGRELKMIELKKEINALLEKSGKKPKYKIPN